MGESYLRRKLLNRIQARRQNNRRKRSGASEAARQTESWSAHQVEHRLPPSPETAPEAGPSSCEASARRHDTQEADSTRHPLRSLGASQDSADSLRSAYSKIRSASRALLFFRRAGSAPIPTPLNHHHNHHRHNNHLPSGALTEASSSGSSSWRSTSSPLPGAGAPQSAAAAAATSQPQLAATKADSAGLGPERLLGPQQQVEQRAAGLSRAAAPTPTPTPPARPQAQFIVPKVNTLKLPLVCLIKSLDGQLMREVFVHRYERGQYLIESLKVSVGLVDSKYFGLRLASSVEEQDDPRSMWLNLNESVCKQLKGKQLRPALCSGSSAGSRSIDFYLRIKFYPPSVARIQDQFLRNYLWLQLRRDLSLGKLTSSMNNLTLLMACVLQYELGDHSSQLADRVQELNILPNQDLIEEQAVELWRGPRLRGSRRHQVQMQFLRTAVILETYGFDYYSVRDHQRQRAYLLGFNYAGLKTVRNGRIVHHFSWHSLGKISYERRMIIFHIHPTEVSKRKQILGFKCLSDDECQSLYMRLLEQKYFFTVDLAYFDKSFLRPACLYEGADEAESGALATLSAAHNGSPVQRSLLSRATSTSSGGGYPAPSDGAGGGGAEPGGRVLQCLDPHCPEAAALCPCAVCPAQTREPTPPTKPAPGSASGWPTTTRSALQRQQATFRRGSSLLFDLFHDNREEPQPSLQETNQQRPTKLAYLASFIQNLLRSMLEGAPLMQLAVHNTHSPQTGALSLRKWIQRLLELCLLVVTLNLLLKSTDLVSNGLLGLAAYLLVGGTPEERLNVTSVTTSGQQQQQQLAVASLDSQSTSAR